MKIIFVGLALICSSPVFAEPQTLAHDVRHQNDREEVPYFPAGACDYTFQSYSEARSFCAEYETGVWRVRTSNGYAYTCECGGPRG